MPISIRERILQNVRTTLATVLAPYSGTVTRGHLSPLEQFGLPFASILAVSDTPVYEVGVLNRELLWTARLWIDDEADNAAVTLETLMGEVQAGLMLDTTRGGYAQHTLEQGVQYLYVVSTERLAGADIHWQCPYKTTFSDPSQGV